MLGQISRIRGLAALLLFVPVLAWGQPARPAVEYRSLLNVAFRETDGELLIGNLHIVFPPSGYEQAQLIVSTSAGEQIATVPLRLESYLSFPVFGKFVPETNPTAIKLTKTGDYVLTVKIADDTITKFPLTIGAEAGEDPYDPPKRFWREGPWRDFGYFSLPASKTAGNVRFNWWMSLRELPAGMNNPSITIHLLEDFKEVGVSRERLRLNARDWKFFSAELVKTKPKKSSPPQLTMLDLVERDRSYLLVVKANGTPIKSFALHTRGGHMLRMEQCRIGFEPHADFISPRFIETRSESGPANLVTDAYWVRRSGERRSFPPTFALNPADRNQRVSKKQSVTAN